MEPMTDERIQEIRTCGAVSHVDLLRIAAELVREVDRLRGAVYVLELHVKTRREVALMTGGGFAAYDNVLDRGRELALFTP